MSQASDPNSLKARFRGYFPVVVDVETAGFNAQTDALLEICAVTLKMDEQGWLMPDKKLHFHVTPFEGANLEPAALEFTGIRDPYSPLRGAVDEGEALREIFKLIRKEQKAAECQRTIMVAHNANFDHSFVMAAAERAKLKRNPFHPFATFDTAALSGLALGQTVLAKACQTAQIPFDNKEAHSALYDTERTAELFCEIVNRWKRLGGWPLPSTSESTASPST
ncbi:MULTISPECIES: ribonuclease T [Salinivibrio]|uniref:Ribonuclease T n=1 Tax=Salinivibrio kushneri TaxID=1908198 RepID=A0AB36JSY9_9GAMM|nr:MULTISPECIES: ribonuclease T [Salinivibrio]ODP97667.1 ribonuclease T [Salinivibrio sp. BNH]OOE35033.1 ribonuclease T [Salinivibrio kushneri]OOE38854.1 ribonuclease T [Salinivibrio kushneri]OOE48477.1 ribonuclease T [Salinivibrio kushneri]OOE54111.1 ribonuclease T [Salinivibrio kushneri]